MEARNVTVITLVADVNIQGHLDRLATRMQADFWRDFWEYLDVRCVTFADLVEFPRKSGHRVNGYSVCSYAAGLT